MFRKKKIYKYSYLVYETSRKISKSVGGKKFNNSGYNPWGGISFDEEREIYWFPSILNMGAQGMIYPEPVGDDLDITWGSYVWRYAKVVDVPEDKEADYNGHKQYLDVENAHTFKKEEFLDACVSMGIVKLDTFNG